MKNVIVGTAGHIDHGKSALVRALTGTDPDRLKEEKQRGITIDLGFAHLQLTPELRLGFVDVPGHERFVKNMLAGAGGIDLVLFVVAADESIKPQTREHFDICRLLGVRRGVVALTKADLVDSDLLELVRLEVGEFVAGSFLEDAPLIPVSAVTGTGLEELRSALTAAARVGPEKNARGRFRLPIDRVFTMRGFGTVVTGTLLSGVVERDQEVEVYPVGRRLRVRGVQVHGVAAEKATAGQRTAVNLADVEPAELARGMVLSEPGTFHAVARVDTEIDLLPSSKPLKNRAPVHFHAGTAEVEAEIRLLNGAPALQPGERAFASIVLREPSLLLPGDRFIIRKFSPVVTIGGGIVLDNGEIRYRKSDNPIARLSALAASDPRSRIELLVREARYGAGLPELAARTGYTEAEIEAAATGSPALWLLRQPQFWLMDHAWAEAVRARLGRIVREYHEQNPLRPGITLQDLRAREMPDAPPFVLDALLTAAKDLLTEGEVVRLRGRQLVLQEDEQQARKTIEIAFERAGLAVPDVGDVLARSGVEARRARSLLDILIREKKLVRVSQSLVFHATALASLRAVLAGRRSTRFNVAAFKEWTGISRKYAIPLLEYLDRERVTRREGDERVVL